MEAIAKIQAELKEQLAIFEKGGKLLEAQREAAHGSTISRNAARDGLYEWVERLFSPHGWSGREAALYPSRLFP